MRGGLCKNRLEKPLGGSPGENALFRLQSPPSSPSRAGGTQLSAEEGRMKEWGVTRASRRHGNGCPASHVRCHTRCGHELLRAPTCCARARRRSEGPTSRGTASVAWSRSAHSSRAVSRAAPVLFKATSSTLFRPLLHFHFFPSSFLSPEEPHVRVEHRLLPFQPITTWLLLYWPSPRVRQQMGCECLYLESHVAGKLSNESTRSVYAGGGTCRAARVWEGEGAGPTE